MLLKKAQVSVEFVLIFSFVFFIGTILIFILGSYSVDVVDSKNKQEVDNFANYIISESNLLQKMSGGFSRKIEIPNSLSKKYNFSVNGSYLILRPEEISSRFATEDLYYYIPGEYSLNITNEDGSYFINLNKVFVDEKNIIILN